jgi:hypothetical protein
VRIGVVGGESLEQLRGVLAAEGGELAGALAANPAGEAFGPLLAASERCRDQAGEYGLLVESIFEGYLVHYRGGRLLEPADADLRLLAGDYLYALGLARLAVLGDLEAVHELADVIALCAQAHSPGPAPSAEAPAAIWMLGAMGVAGGPWPEAQAAKQALREGRPDAGEQGLDVASRRASALGIALEADRALIAFREIVLSGSPTT